MSAKTGVAPTSRDRLGGREEREGGADDLVAAPDPERVEHDHDRVGPVRDADRLGHAEVLRGLALELRNVRPEDEPAVLEHGRERLLQLRDERRVLRLDVDERDLQRHGESGDVGYASSRSGLPPLQDPPAQERDAGDERHDDRVVDVAECFVEVLPLRAERPAGAREREAPDRRADERQDGVPSDRRPEEARGNRDERPDDRRDAAEEDGPVLPAVEPPLGAVEPCLAEVQPAAVALQERAAAAHADPPAEQRADRVADRARTRHREVRRKALLDLVPREDDVLAHEGARGDGARVHHHRLAGGRKDRVDEHQREDRVEPVVADRRRDGVGDAGQDRAEQHRGGRHGRDSTRRSGRASSWAAGPRG